ncbi:MAG: signal peptidase I [Coriobacteriia bacterium]|nr:signal peptidase I [Coriobacteriia bacterium]
MSDEHLVDDECNSRLGDEHLIDDESTRKKSLTRHIVETVILIALAFLLAQVIRFALIEPYLVPTGSMIPSIEINDRVLANKLVFLTGREPQHNDIVVFDDPTNEFPQLIKRVIAVAGDTVDLREGMVYLNGELLDEPYVHDKPTYPLNGVELPFTVPADAVFVLGDNRTNSADSRYFGPIPTDEVRGRAFWTYWPLARFGSLE